MPISIDHIKEPERLRVLLHELQDEHRDLDAVIEYLENAHVDDLLLHRLKKRKLLKKDRIAHIERLLNPDIPA